MKIKSAYKFQLHELTRPVIIYYIVIVALLIFAFVSIKVWDVNMMGGFDAATTIFLFVCGLNAFKQPFHMFMANGISRRTMFIGNAAAFGTVAVGMALIDQMLSLIMSFATPNYVSSFAQMYGERYMLAGSTGMTLPLIATGFVWAVFCYMAAAMLGLFITTAYYRMNKSLKLIISIGLPALLFIVLPIIDTSLFHGEITRGIYRFFEWSTSLLGKGNPYSIVLSNIFSILISGGLVWLLMRRATVKSV